ncbi:MAG TPA: 2-oxo-4-hydroxy-4-carboxy-5-ureidoimidazoline decarboxylase [Mycobacteriales bacterium]|jgi:2-oxo-4-hydroxy-4-carboxy-5-ureidoimidazoline decarboxylase|nr:2-oxo-4-hydroxy-4-carboxy-5-ureidoimidazoline decarboxylase [Mycobacteriales bacterium]
MTEGWLATLNAGADDEALAASLTACCGARRWVEEILGQRPFADVPALLAAADAAMAGLDDADLVEALSAHPRIGEQPTGSDQSWSRQEQSGLTSAAADVLEEIAEANAEYERRFGHVYLVCATGKSADELLAICRARLDNDVAEEDRAIREELAKITRIRLAKLLGP